MSSFFIQAFTFNPFFENTYIVGDRNTGECIIIDPGNLTAEEDREILDWIEDSGLRVAGIYCTHCHIDHLYGVRTLSDAFSLAPKIPEGEVELYESAPVQSQLFQVPMPALPDPEPVLKGGDQIQVGQYEFRILSLPGHSPDHVAFYQPELQVLISGDVLFKGSIGRYDLPGSDYRQLRNSLLQLMRLPNETRVYPGHGPFTTIGEEKQMNPFLMNL